MEKESPSSFFVNDGSFMERFKQLQQENVKGAASENPNQESSATVASSFKPVSMSIGNKAKANTGIRANTISGGKLAFSLKQKSKIVTPSVKLCEDEEEEENGSSSSLVDGAAKRQKLGCPEAPNDSSVRLDVAPASPSDPTVKKVADKLASFVAKNGRNFEHVTRQRNPGDTPFKFLFDESCADFKYYEYRLQVEEKLLGKKKELEASRPGTASNSVSRGLHSTTKHQPSNYHTPASALYEGNKTNLHHSGAEKSGDSGAPSGADPIAMMEYYAKKAAQEERKRPFKQSHDEMPPPASLHAAPGKKGHHMGDYIPLEELEKFMANCNDASAQKAAKEAAEMAKIQADNVGHKLLSKMGWKEGEGLGSSRKGIADPIMAGDVKQNNLGVGAHNPGEVLPEDDIYEQYKKRMMLGYRHRPNPLNNPRKAYY